MHKKHKTKKKMKKEEKEEKNRVPVRADKGRLHRAEGQTAVLFMVLCAGGEEPRRGFGSDGGRGGVGVVGGGEGVAPQGAAGSCILIGLHSLGRGVSGPHAHGDGGSCAVSGPSLSTTLGHRSAI